jgi:DNA-binding response OmpR family regulator
MRVLVVDDDEITRELLTSTLRQAGHKVFELGSAIGVSRTVFQRDIEAVILDVMLPDLNGDKLVQVLRQNSRGKDLAIVLVSSQPAHELRAIAMAADADAIVPKSDIRQRLGTALAQAVQRRLRVSQH